MGCGNSRMDPNHEGVPAGLRPVIRRRLDEIRARVGSFGSTGPMPSKPQINDHSSHHHNNYDAQDCPSTPAKITTDPPRKSECDEVASRREKEDNVGKIGEKLEVEDHEEDGRMLLERDSSPSFRVYCSENIHGVDSKADEFEGFVNDEEKEEQTFSTNEESISSNHVSLSSNEASVKNPNKKGRRGRRFKQIMVKGGKNRFQMHGFHHNIMHRASDNNNPHLLQRAAAA